MININDKYDKYKFQMVVPHGAAVLEEGAVGHLRAHEGHARREEHAKVREGRGEE